MEYIIYLKWLIKLLMVIAKANSMIKRTVDKNFQSNYHFESPFVIYVNIFHSPVTAIEKRQVSEELL